MYQGRQSIKDFRQNCRNVESSNGKGARRLSTAITEDNIERACVVVLLGRRLTIDEVAHVLHISHGWAYENGIQQTWVS